MCLKVLGDRKSEGTKIFIFEEVTFDDMREICLMRTNQTSFDETSKFSCGKELALMLDNEKLLQLFMVNCWFDWSFTALLKFFRWAGVDYVNLL